MYIESGSAGEPAGRIGRVPPDMVPALAHEIQACLAAHPAWLTQVQGMDRTLQALAMNMWDAWLALDEKGEVDILGICSWERYANESYYHIMYLGGKNLRGHMKAGLKEVERYVYMNSGAEIVIVGRPAWRRLLHHYGYREPLVRLSKNVRKALGN